MTGSKSYLMTFLVGNLNIC